MEKLQVAIKKCFISTVKFIDCINDRLDGFTGQNDLNPEILSSYFLIRKFQY